MFSERLRERLEALNRGALNREELPPAAGRPAAARAASAASLVASGEAAAAEIQQASGLPPAGAAHETTLERLIPGVAHVLEADESYYHIARPLADFWKGSALAWRPLPAETGLVSSPGDRLAGSLASLRAAWPREVLLLDLETCGFAGSMVFLVGLVRQDVSGPVVEQLLARSYAEERAIFRALWMRVAACGTLVTFNGKSFDWPVVHDRSSYHGLGRDERGRVPRPEPGSPAAPQGSRDRRPEPAHFDLLHHARRRWRGRLPDCRLQTLESFICRRHRRGDIPGSEIPGAYHEFVRTGDARRLASIVEHNALDLVTLAQLTWVILQESASEEARDPLDVPGRQASGEVAA